jgi:ABC-type lipoprotein export system ATPase subunit
MGSSGSGKTTLMNIIGCLDKPSSGKYFFEGVDITTLSDKKISQIRNRKIGFIFQSFNLLPNYNVMENVLMPTIYNKDISQKEAFKKAKELIELVGLSNRIKHRPNELSGGQQQRVAIARALINSPEIILADEPTGNLDSKNSAEILNLFEKLNNLGVTLIIVTHEEIIAERAKRKIFIKDGVIQ